MALMTAQSPLHTGKQPTYGAANASDTVKWNNSAQFLIVKNGGGGSINVTVVVPGTKFGQNNPDIVVAVPAGEERWIGPFDQDMADSDNLITVQYSGTTSVTSALVLL